MKTKRLFSLLMTLALCLSLVPLGVVPAGAADGVAYIDRHWDESTSTVASEEKTCDTYTTVSNSMDTNWGTGWYVVPENADVTIGSRITVSGAVNLILCDGATLTAGAGITVEGENSLTIYAQSDGDGMGMLEASSGSSNIAGIGGGEGGSGGTVTVNGGTVKATGSGKGAGIGGGWKGSGGSVTINGGTVTATGGDDRSAGIGGGYQGSGGIVEINGGTVTANGNDRAAGIGGGGASGGGTVTITGGTVTAIAGHRAQAIGHGGSSSDSGSLTLGEVKVTAGAAENSATPVAAADRVNACLNNRNNSYVKIEECTPHSYVNYECQWCGAHTPVPYVSDPKNPADTTDCETYTLVQSDTVNWTDGGWYVVNKGVTINTRIEVNGDVNLILCDGARLEAVAGVHLTGTNALTIWGQERNSGTLETNNARHEGCARIGGNDQVGPGSLTVNGGTVKAEQAVNGLSIDIGFGYNVVTDGTATGTLTVNGGFVSAIGSGERAIGVGHLSAESDSAYSMIITGGTLTAKSGSDRPAVFLRNGTLTLGDMKVTAGDDETSAALVEAADRMDACLKKSM